MFRPKNSISMKFPDKTGQDHGTDKKKGNKYRQKQMLIWSNIRTTSDKTTKCSEKSKTPEQSKEPIEVRNWMTYHCLKKLSNGKFPHDVMTVINGFLNWFPAGCWKNGKKNCMICFSPFCPANKDIRLCSFKCLEQKHRNDIMLEYKWACNVYRRIAFGIQNRKRTPLILILPEERRQWLMEMMYTEQLQDNVVAKKYVYLISSWNKQEYNLYTSMCSDERISLIFNEYKGVDLDTLNSDL